MGTATPEALEVRCGKEENREVPQPMASGILTHPLKHIAKAISHRFYVSELILIRANGVVALLNKNFS